MDNLYKGWKRPGHSINKKYELNDAGVNCRANSICICSEEMALAKEDDINTPNLEISNCIGEVHKIFVDKMFYAVSVGYP